MLPISFFCVKETIVDVIKRALGFRSKVLDGKSVLATYHMKSNGAGPPPWGPVSSIFSGNNGTSRDYAEEETRLLLENTQCAQ